MNVSTLQLPLNFSLKVLEDDPDIRGFYTVELPTLTREAVLEQLAKLPAIGWVKSFHYANEVAEDAEGLLRPYCKAAGRLMVQAYEEVNRVHRDVLQSREFIPHPIELKPALVYIRKSLSVWEQGTQRGLFKKNAVSQDVRFHYMELSLPLVVVISRLTLPTEYKDWSEELEILLDRRDLRSQIRYDNWASYGSSRSQPTLAGMIRDPKRLPRHCVPHGAKEIRPRLVCNEGRYGNSFVFNAECDCEDTRDNFLNLGRLNPRLY
ncbi:hypothetical protein NKR23_g1823 [Pleurostoma richardsiae]|uniref:Uncharacterized protein n=1 Tax=Pleurostoma richardsiae TaxID=41990 RepID=A0AA38VNS2_9PEZI|nr:hypothetical protein NKR23_g1823 [Pleurostoma richardsiae]